MTILENFTGSKHSLNMDFINMQDMNKAIMELEQIFDYILSQCKITRYEALLDISHQLEYSIVAGMVPQSLAKILIKNLDDLYEYIFGSFAQTHDSPDIELIAHLISINNIINESVIRDDCDKRILRFYKSFEKFMGFMHFICNYCVKNMIDELLKGQESSEKKINKAFLFILLLRDACDFFCNWFIEAGNAIGDYEKLHGESNNEYIYTLQNLKDQLKVNFKNKERFVNARCGELDEYLYYLHENGRDNNNTIAKTVDKIADELSDVSVQLEFAQTSFFAKYFKT